MEFDPQNCPVGVKNASDIKSTEDRLSLMIEHLTEKVTDLQKEVKDGFKKVDQRLDNFEKSLDSRIDSRIQADKEKHALGAWKWIFITLGGAIVISVVTSLIMRAASL